MGLEWKPVWAFLSVLDCGVGKKAGTGGMKSEMA